MIVSSLVMVIEPVEPSISKVARSSLMSSSSLMTVSPVRMAKSPRIDLRLSPKPGALTAATCSCPRSLLRIQAARASPSLNVFGDDDYRATNLCSSFRRGKNILQERNFLSERRLRGLSNSSYSTFWVLTSGDEVRCNHGQSACHLRSQSFRLDRPTFLYREARLQKKGTRNHNLRGSEHQTWKNSRQLEAHIGSDFQHAPFELWALL